MPKRKIKGVANSPISTENKLTGEDSRVSVAQTKSSEGNLGACRPLRWHKVFVKALLVAPGARQDVNGAGRGGVSAADDAVVGNGHGALVVVDVRPKVQRHFVARK